MEDLSVVLYRKRREERLASRGIKIKKKQYRKSKDGKKLEEPEIKPEYHNDAEDSESTESAPHGNTKLPFGLCKRYGIDVGNDWTPRDAWAALSDKGITPEGAYKRLRAGEEIVPDDVPKPPKDPAKTVDKGKYQIKDIKARRGWGERGTRPWILEGTPEWKDGVPEEEKTGFMTTYCGPRFVTLTDAYIFLKRAGVEEFEDPETGELVNPTQMDLPEPVYEDTGHGYSAMTIGMKKDRYAIYGTDFDGKKVLISEAGSLGEAKNRLMRMGVPDEAISLSPALKKREEDRTSWLKSDKKEFVEEGGVKYGDLRVIPPEKDDWFNQSYTVIGEDENGNVLEKKFSSEKDALAFLKESGAERARGADRKYMNPQELDLPKTIAEVQGKYYQKLELIANDSGGYTIKGTDLDGYTDIITASYPVYTYKSFLENLQEKFNISEDMLEKSEEATQRIKERAEEEAFRDKIRSEFPEKAVPISGRKYMGLSIQPYPDADGVYELTGYDEYGWKRKIATRDMPTIADEFLEKFGIDPSKVEMGDEVRKVYDDFSRRKREFQEISETFDGERYADIELMKDDDNTFRLYGYDQKGQLRRLTYSGSMHEIINELKGKGIENPEKYVKSDVVKKDYDDYVKYIADFDKNAEEIDGKRYIGVKVWPMGFNEYGLYGDDISGRVRLIMSGNNMYELAKRAEASGLDLGKYIPKDEAEIKSKYDEHLNRMKRFEKEAETFRGVQYIDVEADYDPLKKKYFLHGTTVSGERGKLADLKTEENFRSYLESDSGKALEDFKCTDRLKERLKKVKKARDAIASGEYYDMDVDGHAFKNVYAKKLDDKWVIRGTDVDGKDRKIADARDWDDAVSAMEQHNVKDYKMLTENRTYERPTDGIRHVVLAKQKDGVFKVYADSDTKGTHAEVYSSQSEEEARKWLSDNNIDSSGLRTVGMNPNDDVPRTHTQKALENYDTYRMDAVSGSVIEDLTEYEKNEAAEMLKTLFTHGAYRCARSTKSFGPIIDDRYKSQMETGTAGFGASNNKRARERCSKKMYGHAGHIDLEDRDYEKCGYLGADDDEYDYDTAFVPHYGGFSSCVYTFRKDRMADRAHYTFGDSLNSYTSGYLRAAGYAGENPTLEGLTALGNVGQIQTALKDFRRYKKGEISFNEMFKEIKQRLDNGYIEMQFNGDVTVEDIEKVTFKVERCLKDAFDGMDSDMRKRVIKRLKENNVQILYRKSREDPFEDAWGYIKQNYAEDFE